VFSEIFTQLSGNRRFSKWEPVTVSLSRLERISGGSDSLSGADLISDHRCPHMAKSVLFGLFAAEIPMN
jgi:hypothetical protein